MGLRFFLLILIVVTNGFFAAAEVALVSVRQSRLKELAEEGHAGAQSALNLLANPGRLLSVTQVGVTLASLGLGWAGEDTVYGVLRAALNPLQVHIAPVFLHAFAFGMAFLLISYGHVILGEVVPKNLAIEKADRVAMLTAPVLLVFYGVSQPFVVVIERSAALVLRMFGLQGGHARGGHSIEELKYIIESSRTEGHLEAFQEDAIQNVIELGEVEARQIMTPRPNIVSVAVDAGLEELLAVMVEHKFTRIPVYENAPEQIIGFIHYKDLMRVWDERRFAHERKRPARAFRLRKLIRKPLVIPETKPLSELVDEFRKAHTHLALVVDEYGTVSGLITLEDVLRQIFGDIGDEHDVVRPNLPQQDRVLQIDGNTSIRDLESHYNIVLPSEAGFETLAGFLLYQFGYIPSAKDSIEYGGRRFTITDMERNRIARVLVEKLDAAPADPANEG